MLLLADYVLADEALSSGYAYQVCPRQELEGAAHALAHRLIGLSSVTQVAVTESLRRLVMEQSLKDQNLRSEEGREGKECVSTLILRWSLKHYIKRSNTCG